MLSDHIHTGAGWKLKAMVMTQLRGISSTCCDFSSALSIPAVTDGVLFVDVTGTDSVGTNPEGKVLLKYLFLLFTLWLNQTSLQKNQQ